MLKAMVDVLVRELKLSLAALLDKFLYIVGFEIPRSMTNLLNFWKKS
jgi:hypothetical protein